MKRSAYEEKDREAKNIVSGDNRRWIKNKATDAENAAKLDQLGTLYKITKQLCNDSANALAGVRSNDKYLLTQEDLDEDKWKKKSCPRDPQ